MPARPSPPSFTVGVEEEFFVVDAESGELSADGPAVIAAAKQTDHDQLDEELSRSQVESGTMVCSTLDELERSVTSLRARLSSAAESVGSRIMASGTHPSSHWSEDGGINEKAGYRYLEAMYGQLTDEQVVCGCHVHVAVEDPDLAIEIMNRARTALPVLLALSANSPYWLGDDTRYASYRAQIFGRWPTSGIPEPVASRAAYEDLMQTLVDTEAIDSPARIYWDLRPSARYPTLEFRSADVPMTVSESVALAGVARALVETCHQEVMADRPQPEVRPEVLRAAVWRASRFGLKDSLVDIEASRAAPAPEVLNRLLDRLRPALEARGDWERVSETTAATVSRGTGAERQRSAFAERGRLADVVDAVCRATLS